MCVCTYIQLDAHSLPPHRTSSELWFLDVKSEVGTLGHSGTADRNIVQFLVTHPIPQYRHLKLGSPILQHSRVAIG